MKNKIKKVLLFALPALSVLSVFAIYGEFITRLILVLTYVASVMSAGIAFWDTYKGTDAAAKLCYKMWKYFAGVAGAIMFGSFGLCMVALMGSEFLMSLVTGLVPLFGPVFGAKLGFIIKARHP